MNLIEALTLLGVVVAFQVATVGLVVYFNHYYRSTQNTTLRELQYNTRRIELANRLAIELAMLLRSYGELYRSLSSVLITKTKLGGQCPGLRQEFVSSKADLDRAIAYLMLLSPDRAIRRRGLRTVSQRFRDPQTLDHLTACLTLFSGKERSYVESLIVKIRSDLKRGE